MFKEKSPQERLQDAVLSIQKEKDDFINDMLRRATKFSTDFENRMVDYKEAHEKLKNQSKIITK